mmetsp:Transcript_104188/g.304200  ORF Transcript_104188/g.304200 Transcript_104188/m.304200 type:complete len:444 (-) Transcript_104188:228-1559(-)
MRARVVQPRTLVKYTRRPSCELLLTAFGRSTRVCRRAARVAPPGAGGRRPRGARRGRARPRRRGPAPARSPQVYDQRRDVVDDLAAELAHPALPGHAREVLRGVHGALGREAGHGLHGLVRTDELPDAVAAEQHEAVRGRVDAVAGDGGLAAVAAARGLALRGPRQALGSGLGRGAGGGGGAGRHDEVVHVGHGRDARVLAARHVAHGARHVEARVALAPGVALALDVDAVVPAPVEEHHAPGALDARALLGQVGLVVHREVQALPRVLRARELAVLAAQDHAAVAHVREVEHALAVVVEDHGGRGAAAQGVDLLHVRGLLDEHLRLLEGRLQCARGIRLEVLLRQEDLRQVVLDEVRDVVALAPVAVEDPVQGELALYLQDEEAVLVRGLRLQALLASIADELFLGIERVTRKHRRFGRKGVHVVHCHVRLRAHTELALHKT